MAKLPEVCPNVIRSWLDDIATYGRATDDWTLTREHFEALCRYALAQSLPQHCEHQWGVRAVGPVGYVQYSQFCIKCGVEPSAPQVGGDGH